VLSMDNGGQVGIVAFGNCYDITAGVDACGPGRGGKRGRARGRAARTGARAGEATGQAAGDGVTEERHKRWREFGRTRNASACRVLGLLAVGGGPADIPAAAAIATRPGGSTLRVAWPRARGMNARQAPLPVAWLCPSRSGRNAGRPELNALRYQ
jgi:hypothetical protein